jgi:3',5'-cyclic AMP phosphodiesterase CpdA
MLILHLSDIHFRHPICNTDRDPDRPFRTRLMQDARARVKTLGSVDAILVGGDIAFAGKPEEYGAALEWLYELADACECDRTRIFVIPGIPTVSAILAPRSPRGFGGPVVLSAIV